MSSTNLNDVTSGYNLVKINANFQEIERVLNEEVLHRVNDGTLPNTLETSIDANGQPIYNLRKPQTGGEPLRLKDLFGSPEELLQGPEVQELVATEGQTLFTLASSYVPGSNAIRIYRNGVLLSESEYTETSTTSFTLSSPVNLNDVIYVVPVAVSGGGTSSSTTASNVGTGASIYKVKVGDTLQFKTLTAGSNITLTQNENDVQISASTGSDVTAANLGTTGEGVFASKVGTTLNLKKLRAGSNVTLTSDSEGITIAASGGGGGSSVAVYESGVLKTSAASSLNFVNSSVGVAGSAVTITDAARDFVNVKDYGATGDGTTNDSTAIQNAITYAQANGKGIFFPDGSYVISSLGTQAGRLIMKGTGNSTLKGTFVYYEPSPPVAADVSPTQITATADFFGAEGINFQSTSSDYALKLSTIQQDKFLSTFNLSHCKFFGNKGLLAQHMIGFELTNCEFNNVVCGARVEGCVNGLWTACRFQNSAESGVFITGHATEGNRRGGENMRFVNCEWAVCTYGIIANEHMWLTLDSCLLDYCDTPLYLSGAQWAKAVNTYFGAKNTASTLFSGVTGYLAPGPRGTAVYGRPSGTPVGSRTFGFTAHNCEFIQYDYGTTGAAQPIVYLDGYVNGTYQMSCDEVAFYDCLFYAATDTTSGHTHTMSTLLEISHAAIARVIGNRFRSYNASTSMTNAYRTVNCFDWINHSNSFWNCTQSSVQVRSAYELGTGTVVSASEPTSPYPGMIWVTP